MNLENVLNLEIVLNLENVLNLESVLNLLSSSCISPVEIENHVGRQMSVLLSRYYSGTVEVIDGFCSFNFIVDNTERITGDDSKAGGLLARTGGKIQ